MNDMEAEKGTDAGPAIKTRQGQDGSGAELQLTREAPPGTAQSPRAPAPWSAKPAGGQAVGNQSHEQKKPLRKDSRVPRGPPEPTVLERGGDDLLRRRPRPRPVAGLHHQAILGELI